MRKRADTGRGFAYWRWATLNGQCWSRAGELFARGDGDGDVCENCLQDFDTLNPR